MTSTLPWVARQPWPQAALLLLLLLLAAVIHMRRPVQATTVAMTAPCPPWFLTPHTHSSAKRANLAMAIQAQLPVPVWARVLALVPTVLSRHPTMQVVP